jgi:SlyX protein
MEERLEKIESKLSLAEDLLDELNKTIYHQQREIERLQREILTLREQLRASLPEERRNLLDEIPPHY